MPRLIATHEGNEIRHFLEHEDGRREAISAREAAKFYIEQRKTVAPAPVSTSAPLPASPKEGWVEPLKARKESWALRLGHNASQLHQGLREVFPKRVREQRPSEP